MSSVQYLRSVFCVCAATILFTAGCSTSIGTSTQKVSSHSVEHDALQAAADAVIATPWPKPQKSSIAARLTGLIDGSGDSFNESDAVAFYLNSLSASGPEANAGQVFSDAARHLEAADRLAISADAAAMAIRPTNSDIQTVEECIVTLQGSRDIYIASLKQLQDDGASIQSAHIKDLRRAFSGAIKGMGAAADRLADRVEADRTTTFAGPEDSLQAPAANLVGRL